LHSREGKDVSVYLGGQVRPEAEAIFLRLGRQRASPTRGRSVIVTMVILVAFDGLTKVINQVQDPCVSIYCHANPLQNID
jgi:hypothetical protein